MSTSQIKKVLLNTKPERIYLKSALIASLALLSFNTNAITKSENIGAILNKALQCSHGSPCDTTLQGKTGYAYSITLEGCPDEGFEKSLLYSCKVLKKLGGVNVQCGASDTVVITLSGDNVLCNTNEDVHIYYDKNYAVLVSVQLLPTGAKGDPGPEGPQGEIGLPGPPGPAGMENSNNSRGSDTTIWIMAPVFTALTIFLVYKFKKNRSDNEEKTVLLEDF